MIQRKALQKLLDWKRRSQGKTALLIEGARGVGKSTLAAEFGRHHYRSHILIDFSHLPREVAGIFENLRTDLDRFFQYLSAYYGVTLCRRESLIIFDEVQDFPKARAFVKHLVADGRCDCIETGSLLSIRQNTENIIIPSEEESFRLNPLDFEEFLGAAGEEALAALIRESFARGEALPAPLHRKAMRAFREYMLVGGMPRAAEAFAQTRSFQEADEEKRRILELCRMDADRLSRGFRHKVLRILDEIPAQLSKHEKKFVLTSLSRDARMRAYEKAFFWLSDAQITIPCFAAADPSAGLAPDHSASQFKCFMADTGLLATMARMTSNVTEEDLYRSVLLGKVGINEGMLTENVIAQTLTAKGDRLFFYSQSGLAEGEERMEIDFLIVRPFADAAGKLRVSTIEVKPSMRTSAISLDRFAAKFTNKIGCEYIFYPGPFKREGRRLCVPLYAAHCV